MKNKSCLQLLLTVIIVMFFSEDACAEPRIRLSSWVRESGTVNWTEPTIEFIADEYPEILDTRFGYDIGLAARYSPGEEMGIMLNGEFVGEDGEYISHYKTQGLIFSEVNAIEFEPGSYQVRIVATAPNGEAKEGHAELALGYQDGKGVEGKWDRISMYFITNCEVEGIFTIEYYIDGELISTSTLEP